MHGVDQCNHILHRGLLQHAVAEVEDMAGPAAGLIENLLRATADFARIGKKYGGIEIALDGAIVADRAPGVVQSHPPIDADHRAAGLAQQRQEGRIAGGEMHQRHARRKALGDRARVRQHIAAVIVRTEATYPAIEKLHRLGAGGDLGVEIARDGAGEAGQ